MKSELINDLIKANQRLLKAIEKMPEDKKIGDWGKKEIVAHVAGWYEEGVDGIPKILVGQEPNSFRLSVDNYNKNSVEKRENKTITKILEELNNLHKEFIEQIKNLSEEQIKNFYGTKLGNENINVLWMIDQCISHDNNHKRNRGEILIWLMQKDKYY